VSRLILPRRDLIVPTRHKQRGFIINPYVFGANPGAGYRSRLQFGGADASTTFTDDTGKTWTAFGNAQIDTSLGDQRGLFDGNGDYIKTPTHADLVFGVSDFKIAFTMRFNSKTGFQTICSKGYTGLSTALGWLVQTGNGDGRLILYRANTTNTVAVVSETTGTINAGQDYAIEIERVGNTYTIKRDGVQVASNSAAGNNFTSTDEMSIGGGTSTGFNGGWFNGWIKDFRMT
jgi:hypothetical protein